MRYQVAQLVVGLSWLRTVPSCNWDMFDCAAHGRP